MANPFYNPYQKGPDFGGGLSSMGNNLGMMMLIKKLLGQQGGGEQTPVAEPAAPMGTPMNTGAMPVPGAQGMTPPGQTNLNPGAPNLPPMQDQPFGQAGQGIDPGVMDKIQKLLGMLKMQGMPGQGGGLR